MAEVAPEQLHPEPHNAPMANAIDGLETAGGGTTSPAGRELFDALPWALVAKHLTPRAWGRACSTARATFTARPSVVLAEPGTALSRAAWRLDNWPGAHSLLLRCGNPDARGACDARTEGPTPPSARGEAFHWLLGELPAKEALRTLVDVHVWGGLDVLNALAHHGVAFPVLFLAVASLRPAVFALQLYLRHVVLYMGVPLRIYTDEDGAALRTLATLAACCPALVTLRYEARSTRLEAGADMRCCGALEAVALRDVVWRGNKEELALPAGCQLCIDSESVHVLTNQKKAALDEHISERVSALVLRLDSRGTRRINNGLDWLLGAGIDTILDPRNYERDVHWLALQRLRHLRIVAEGSVPYVGPLELVLQCECVPALEVVEVQHVGKVNLAIEVPLRRLVVITEAEAVFLANPNIAELAGSLAALYVEHTAVLMPVLEELCGALGGRVDKDEVGFGNQSIVRVRAPADLPRPDLEECICGACLHCLERAGWRLAAHGVPTRRARWHG